MLHFLGELKKRGAVIQEGAVQYIENLKINDVVAAGIFVGVLAGLAFLLGSDIGSKSKKI